MNSVKHQEQQKIWDKEHTSPQVLLQMDSADPSSGVVKFWEWFEKTAGRKTPLKGLEMGCGKGRNVIYLAGQGVRMTGFDFSPKAIEVAKERAKDVGLSDKAEFLVGDATTKWNFETNLFDFAIDCFASTDIESQDGRQFAISEMIRVVKPGGYILAYVMSTDDEFHKEMIGNSPASEKNSFIHSTGKFEKTFDSEELFDLYKGLEVVRHERIPKTTTFSGKQYSCYHHWIVFKKDSYE